MRWSGTLLTLFLLLITAARAEDVVPRALLGTWVIERPTQDYCDEDGRCMPSSGGELRLSFAADGYAEFSLLRSALVEGCGEVRVYAGRFGQVEVAGDVITFRPRYGTSALRDPCRPGQTAETELTGAALAPFRLTWSVVPDPEDPTKTELVIADETGKASGTYRQE